MGVATTPLCSGEKVKIYPCKSGFFYIYLLKSRWPMRNAWRTQEVNELVGLGPGW